MLGLVVLALLQATVLVSGLRSGYSGTTAWALPDGLVAGPIIACGHLS